MAQSLLPHGLSRSLARLAVEADAAMTPIMTRIGELAEAAAKENLGEGGAHKAGYVQGGVRPPAGGHGHYTTAIRGRGPAVVTGALRRAATHEMVGMKTVRVGCADIPHPPEKANWKAPKATSGQIGGYLEEVWGYPWLEPAVVETMAAAEPYVDDVISELRW